jgi:RHS repeat-associated protein
MLVALGAAVPAAAQPPPSLVEYYHLDALGSVRLVTDATGQIVRRHDYLPFGEEWLPPATPSDPFRFTGKPRDAETALDYFGARYYRPRLGRFTTVDPVMAVDDGTLDPQRWNRYGYAANNPFRYIDPDGRAILTKLAKLILKGGDVATTVAGVIEDYDTLTDENASLKSRAWAGASLASELLPLSVRDLREAGGFALNITRRQLPEATGQIRVFNIDRLFGRSRQAERDLAHIFQPKHGLDALGSSKREIVDKLVKSLFDADRAGLLVRPFNVRRIIDGYEVEITGNIVNGELRISNAWLVLR